MAAPDWFAEVEADMSGREGGRVRRLEEEEARVSGKDPKTKMKGSIYRGRGS